MSGLELLGALARLHNASANGTEAGPAWVWALPELNMQQTVLIGLGVFVVSFACVLGALLRLRAAVLKCRRRREVLQGTLHGNAPHKKSALGGMIARIEELESLTPLIVTPSSVPDDAAFLPPLPAASYRQRSPPLPRRFAGGRVCLVPLGTGLLGRERRAAPYVVPDYEMTISSTFRSVGTIPEVSENGLNSSIPHSVSGTSIRTLQLRGGPFADLDLISIDRTSVSTLERPLPNGQNGRARPQTLGASASNPLPGNGLSPLEPPYVHPAKRSVGVNGKTLLRFEPGERRLGSRDSSGDSLSSALSSPQGSSLTDSASPLDTSGSLAELSDSVYMASESETSEAPRAAPRLSSSDAASSAAAAASSTSADLEALSAATLDWEPSSSRRFLLHRIEEESEWEADRDAEGNLTRCRGTEESLSALSADPGSILDSECNRIALPPPPPPHCLEGLI